jgi:hypothetical protein
MECHTICVRQGIGVDAEVNGMVAMTSRLAAPARGLLLRRIRNYPDHFHIPKEEEKSWTRDLTSWRSHER